MTSAALHALWIALLLVIMQTIVPAPPPEPAGVALVFEPAPATHPEQTRPLVPAPTPPPKPAPEPPPTPAVPPQPAAALPPPTVQPLPPPPVQPPPTPAVPPPPAPLPAAPAAEPPPPTIALPLPPPVAPPPPPLPHQAPVRQAVAPHPPVPAVPAPRPPPPASMTAPSTAPAAVPPAPASAPAPQISAAWTTALANWLASHKIYPEAARRRGEQGNVTVRFTVEPSGRVTQVAVVHSSGSPRLDAAAEAMLRGADLPPFDATMQRAPVTATVQIRYALED